MIPKTPEATITRAEGTTVPDGSGQRLNRRQSDRHHRAHQGDGRRDDHSFSAASNPQSLDFWLHNRWFRNLEGQLRPILVKYSAILDGRPGLESSFAVLKILK
jgi:hypothetical protein